MAMTSQILKVPGARIYYEVYGSGPVLIMIPGGPADAGVFAAVATYLGDRYTVVPYDPRGNSRSVLDGPAQDQLMDLHGDDVAALISALGSEPAYVFGSSGGAQIGLNLAARHPECLRTLVAHEPPCLGLLPDAREQRAFMDSVVETFRREGVGPAMQKFQAGAGVGGGPPPADMPSEAIEMFRRIGGNMEFFLAHGIEPISGYIPDVDTLRKGAARLVIGIGETSAGQLAYRTAVALAERVGSKPASFPGGHAGYVDYPAQFAERLHQVLSA